MDPAGPWSAYASYNRLTGVQGGTASGDLHHHLPSGTAGAPPTTNAQLLPGGFLSQTPVGYDTVFSPLFHHAAGTKQAAHYVTQHRTLAKQPPEGEYHQSPALFEQGTWQQNSPFGILPHESVVPTTGAKATYENFNAHFAAAQSLNHLNSQLAAAKTAASRAQSPQVSGSTGFTVSPFETFF